jgi:hypothetical protein
MHASIRRTTEGQNNNNNINSSAEKSGVAMRKGAIFFSLLPQDGNNLDDPRKEKKDKSVKTVGWSHRRASICVLLSIMIVLQATVRLTGFDLLLRAHAFASCSSHAA